ncbi:MAG: DNA-directed RNA polymerase subunit omega [Clostridiales bacterium]|jgi:DNA-directed RNA polymerase omega subunit|nr:DNA-directed RNA polymerase subunit omega [Clostridiales bacterium]HOB63962.1 DNA-directed RNA polymerase subunit omega [Clostridia bacterium]HOK81166.1 DNA-directed RNA polymerase subunit omega [Clostridia bacterium]HOL60285.1 DNA-directed RNA polymerase subunit omega [Clostridia bacterium]HPO53818.1 DNA-directed RNA polymerase subunit omega [Clostridia bacterium]
MIDPPIDKLIKKAPCRYALVVAITKRTKELLSMDDPELEASGMKAISYAAKEIYEGKIRITK